jgi:atypical dual specificity phosphatase
MPPPKGWLEYSKFGQQIPGTQFVALKCPLRETMCNNLPPEQRFSPETLKLELPSLELIIDLTNTSKYYTPYELVGLQHEKVTCTGQQVPNADVQSRFFEVVDSFLQSDESRRGGLIGVHCTHGVNRTGFLICKYMVSKMDFSPEEAVRAFNTSRGHMMEHEAYVRALQVPEELLSEVLGQRPY